MLINAQAGNQVIIWYADDITETEGGKTFQVSTIKLWNSLPNNLKKENTINN